MKQMISLAEPTTDPSGGYAVVVLEKPPRALVLAFVVPAVLVCLAAAVSSILDKPELTGLALSLGIMASFMGVAVVNTYHRRRRSAHLDVSTDELRLDGDGWMAREDVTAAEVARWKWQVPVVRLRIRGRRFPIDLQVADDEMGRRVVDALGFGAERSVARYVLPWARLYRDGQKWVGALMVALMFGAVAWLLLMLLVLIACGVNVRHVGGEWGLVAIGAYVLLVAWLARLSRAHVEIGPDGVGIRQWGKDRFIRYDAVVASHRFPTANADHEGVELVLTSGETVALYTHSLRIELGFPHQDPVAERLERARQAYRNTTPAPELHELLQPHVSVRSWIDELRAAGRGARDGLRSAALTRDALWGIVESPTASPVARAAAGVALASSGDETTRERLTAISARTASPDVCAALHATLREDDAKLERALARCAARQP